MSPSEADAVPRFPWAASAWCFLGVVFPNILAAIQDEFGSIPLRLLKLFFSVGLVLLPWVLLPARWFMWVSLPLALMAVLESLHVILIKAPSSIGMIHSILETTPGESVELLRQAWPALSLLTLLPMGTGVALWWTRSMKQKPDGRSMRVRFLFAVVAMLGIASEPAHVLWFLRHTLHPVLVTDELTQQSQRTFPFGTLWKLEEAVGSRIAAMHRQHLAKDFSWRPVRSADPSLPETYVVVIGESSRSGNWSAYGYHLPTNPRLQADSEVVVFADVMSTANITLESVPLLLSLATPHHPGAFDTTSSVISCFRQAGFKTWWLSTQGQFTIWDGKPARIGYEADTTIFLSSERAGRKSLDESLLPELDAALADTTKKKLIVLHTNGSHFPYNIRYTPGFDVFKPGVSMSDTVSSYDNSILYTDWLIAETIDRIRSKAGVSGFVFTSDHGEALGEEGKYFHCGLQPVRAEFEVPYLAWVSPELERIRSSVLQHLRSNRNRKASHADFVPTLLDLAGIRSERIDSTRSLAGPSYREHPRWATTPAYDLVETDRLKGSSRNAPPSPLRP